MVLRKTTKTQSRRKLAPVVESVVATVSSNGDSIGAAPAVKNGASLKNCGSPSFQQIQRRAYELFEARGARHGFDLADWLTAEHELSGTAAATH